MFENPPNNNERLDSIKEELSNMDSDKLSKIVEGTEASDITLDPNIDDETIKGLAQEVLDSKE